MTTFAQRIVQFTRLLRRAGLPVGPGQMLGAVRAACEVGMVRREDLYWGLHAALVNEPTHHEIFDQAFALFWRDPQGADAALSLLLPHSQVPPSVHRERISRRVRQAHGVKYRRRAERAVETDTPVQMWATFSATETLRHRDFEQMTAEEVARARALIARLSLPVPAVPSRRLGPDVRGKRVDLRRTVRASLAGGGGTIRLRHRARRRRIPDLVLLCDISGSMDRYSRLLLHFMHAITGARERVHSFVFGTRLTHVSRLLRHRDVDEALARLGAQVHDWGGGTRIGACLRAFNLHWRRRVLGRGAVVLLLTDGLDRDPPGGLGREAACLRRSCRRLIWLNPLLRYEGFEPCAAGIRALLPHVDEFRPVHNLASLEQLAQALDTMRLRPRSRGVAG